MPIDPAPSRKTPSQGKIGRTLGLIGAWAWAVVAGGGGFLLLLEKGPLPLTNGWFALLSGISGCPLTAWLLKKFTGIVVSGRVRFFTAAFIFVAGRMALILGM